MNRWQVTTEVLSTVNCRCSVIRTKYHIGISRTPFLQFGALLLRFSPTLSRSTPITITKSNISQNQSDVQSKKEGEKKKAKSIVTCHKIESKGTGQKSKAKVPVYNFNKMRQSGRKYYFGPQPKAGATWTVEDNPIDLSDEGDD